VIGAGSCEVCAQYSEALQGCLHAILSLLESRTMVIVGFTVMRIIWINVRSAGNCGVK
jgi:hypothetical protein